MFWYFSQLVRKFCRRGVSLGIFNYIYVCVYWVMACGWDIVIVTRCVKGP